MTSRAPNIWGIGLRRSGAFTGRRLAQLSVGLALLVADIGAAIGAIAIQAALSASLMPPVPTSWESPTAVTALMLGAVVLFLAQQGQYTRRQPFWSVLGDVLSASAAGLVGTLFVLLAFKSDELLLPVVAWAAFPVCLVALRRVARMVLSAAGQWDVRVLVVGSAETVKQATGALLSEPALGYKIAGVVTPAAVAGVRTASVWRSLFLQYGADILVLAPDPLDGLEQATLSLVRERIPFAVAPRPDGLPVHGLERTRFFSHDTVMFTYRNNLAQPVSRLVKVVFDVGVAMLLLLMLSPVFAAIALLVSLDGGPVFYRHTRVGAGGRLFPCLKFRSMVHDGDAVLRRVLATDPDAAAEWRASRKLKNDPRVTWVGRILRNTSLDELPQLLNVLRLEMSLVGPRPIVEAELVRYGDDVVYYFEARPGLTGLWQVSGRSDTSYDQRVRLDTWYVKNWTIWHDLAILAKTIPAVLKRRGAV